MKRVDPSSPDREKAEALNLYFQEIGKFPRLTPEEEKALGRRIQQGDESAHRRLVECNLRFVVSYAKRYRGMGISYLDLIHEGNLGLMEAARRFDPERNVKFISYAVWWIRQSIIQVLSEHMRVFSVPSRMSRAFGKIEREFTEDGAKAGTPAPEEVAASLDLSLGDVEKTDSGFVYHVFVGQDEYTFTIRYEKLEGEHMVNSIIEGSLGSGRDIKVTVDGHLCPFATTGIVLITAGSSLLS